MVAGGGSSTSVLGNRKAAAEGAIAFAALRAVISPEVSTIVGPSCAALFFFVPVPVLVPVSVFAATGFSPLPLVVPVEFGFPFEVEVVVVVVVAFEVEV